MKKEEISLKNTKAEILDALNAALEREKDLASSKSNPEKEEKEKNVAKAIENSKNSVEQNIFSQELIKKFKDLELAISTEEEKLKELYGVENELCNLTMVINAGKDAIASIEERKNIEEEILKTKITELEQEYNLKISKLKEEFDAESLAIKTKRIREEEEYTYNKKREREISNNKWEDEKAQRESKIAIAEAETFKLLEEAKTNAKHLDELEQKVNSIPEILKAEYDKGKKEATDNLEKEHKYAIELLKKDYESTIMRNEDKIASLTSEIEKITNLNNMLQNKLDKAYAEVKELATKTVEATGGVKILGSNAVENK